MPAVDLVVLGEHGQIGDKEQVIEELYGARFAVGLEDRYIVETRPLGTLVELQYSLVNVGFGF